MDRILTTSEGLKLELLVVSQAKMERVQLAVVAEFKAAGEPIDPPTYVSAAGEAIQWTAESVAKDGSDADKAAWAIHADAVARCERAANLRVLKTQIISGIKPEDRTPPAGWLEEQRWLGVELPEDPREQSIRYVEDEVLKTPDDIITFSKQIVLMSLEGAIDEQEVEAIEATFRTALRESRGPISDRIRNALNVSGGKPGGGGVAVQLPDARVPGRRRPRGKKK